MTSNSSSSVAMGPKKAAAKPAKSAAAAGVKKVSKKVEAAPEKKATKKKVTIKEPEEEEEGEKEPSKPAVAKRGPIKPAAMEKTAPPVSAPALVPKKRSAPEAAVKPAPKSEKTKTSNNDTIKPTNIVYLGHIPPNFEEKELRKFFTQYGKVKKLKLHRSAKRPFRPKGYAFIMFEDEDVAAVVGTSINGYLMGGKQLVCHVVPSEKVSNSLLLSLLLRSI